MDAFEKQVPLVFETVKLAVLHCAKLFKVKRHITNRVKASLKHFIISFVLIKLTKIKNYKSVI
jgi:hypothetical protein